MNKERYKSLSEKLFRTANYILNNLEIEKCTLPENPAVEDKWILSRLDKVIKKGTEEEISSFAENEFCRFYVDFTKPRIYGENLKSSLDAQRVLCIVFGEIIRLFSPFTEEFSGKLPEMKDIPSFSYPEEELSMDKVCLIIGAVCDMRNEYSLPPSRRTNIFVLTDNTKALEDKTVYFEKFAAAKSVIFTENKEVIPEKTVCRNMGNISVFIPDEELFDTEKEAERLFKEKERLEAELERSRNIFENKTFLAKAPHALIEEEKEKERNYKEQYEKILRALKR